MLGAVIIVIVLLVVLPIGFVVGGGVVAALLGQSLTADGEARHAGSELVDLNR